MVDLGLGEAAVQLEAARFVGRESLLELARAALGGTSPHRVLLVHGPGGVGKSALLRAIERLAAADGHPVVHLDGRLVAPTPEGIRSALAPAAAEGTLVLIDEVDELAPLRLELRRALLEILPSTATVVLAGRRAPGREWFEGGLATMATSLAVRPLSSEESAELLARSGIDAPGAVQDLVAWGQGYPLALTLAASLATSTGAHDPGLVPDGRHHGPEATLDDVLLSRLGGDELAGIDPDVLDVACIAPAVDARLLAAALPGRPTREGLAQLRALSITEPVGPRTTLHRLARAALRTRLRQTDPDRHRALVLRIAAHLRDRGLSEGPLVGLELAELAQEPALLIGFDQSTTHYADFATAADLATIAESTGVGEAAWFGRFRRWYAEQPRQVVVVRRADGTLSAMSIICMAAEMPPWAWDDIETGPILRRAEAAGALRTTAMMHDTMILETDPVTVAEVVRVGNTGSMALGTIRNPRYIYVTAPARREGDGTEPLGFVEVPELRRADAERELVTIMTDYGPDGFVGLVYSMILAEQQAEVPTTSGARGLAVIEALRSFHDDGALAANLLAEGAGADRARAAVQAALDAAFDASEADRFLRTALERTYLDPDGGHGIAQRELHMSRSSFYRHLQRARQQLATSAGRTDPT